MSVREVRVRCERCGPRVLPLDAVRLLDRGERAEYRFTCDRCGLGNRRPADEALCAALRGVGAVGFTLHRTSEA